MAVPISWKFPVFVLVLGLSNPAAAEVYIQVDESGISHFTDSPMEAGYQLFWTEAVTGRESRFDTTIRLAAASHGLDPDLVKAIVKAESGFDPKAVSKKGARGLMQLMPETAKQYGVKDPFDPKENIRAGTRHLKRMLDRFGSTEKALAAYNAGPTVVMHYKGIPPYRETREYVKRVMRYWKAFRSQN